MEKKDSFLKDILEVIIASVIIVFILIKFILMPVEVVGKSMLPTLYEGERGFSFVIAKSFGLKRFDIVVVEYEPKLIVKRLIGLPNETIEYKDNKLYIDGVYYEEPYLDNAVTNDFVAELGPDEYFVLGDNREVSKDSRIDGPFKIEDIKASKIFVISPFKDFGIKK